MAEGKPLAGFLCSHEIHLDKIGPKVIHLMSAVVVSTVTDRYRIMLVKCAHCIVLILYEEIQHVCSQLPLSKLRQAKFNKN